MTTIKLGITGGIGSGKSVVSRILRLMDVPVYDCDSQSKYLTEHNNVIRSQLIDLLGNNVYFSNGKLNKSFLASYVFSDSRHTAQINQIIHPIVKVDFENWAINQNPDILIIGMESAILFEAKLEKTIDKILFVQAPFNLRIQRTMERDDLSFEQVKMRIRAQMDDDEKMKRSHFVAINDDEHSLLSQIQNILNGLKGLSQY
jgi:dephospho-CoA kinase